MAAPNNIGIGKYQERAYDINNSQLHCEFSLNFGIYEYEIIHTQSFMKVARVTR